MNLLSGHRGRCWILSQSFSPNPPPPPAPHKGSSSSVKTEAHQLQKPRSCRQQAANSGLSQLWVFPLNPRPVERTVGGKDQTRPWLWAPTPASAPTLACEAQQSSPGLAHTARPHGFGHHESSIPQHSVIFLSPQIKIFWKCQAALPPWESYNLQAT